MEPIIFVDLDGVLVDLKKGLGDILSADFTKHSHEELKPIIESYLKNLNTRELISFWSNLPKTKDCDKLWSVLKSHQPLILSASGNNESSCAGKKLWCKKHLNLESDRVFCSKNSKDKEKYASPKCILIDDYKKNIVRFNKNGGHGIHHTRTKKTIHELNKILKKFNITQT